MNEPFAAMFKSDYIKEATRTESVPFLEMITRKEVRLLHASMGLATEAAEFVDSMKKHFFYKKELDSVNLREELGDMCWYMAIAMDALETNFEEVQAINIAKLKARYPNKFCSEKAQNRDLDTERQILEGTHISQERPVL